MDFLQCVDPEWIRECASRPIGLHQELDLTLTLAGDDAHPAHFRLPVVSLIANEMTLEKALTIDGIPLRSALRIETRAGVPTDSEVALGWSVRHLRAQWTLTDAQGNTTHLEVQADATLLVDGDRAALIDLRGLPISQLTPEGGALPSKRVVRFARELRCTSMHRDLDECTF